MDLIPAVYRGGWDRTALAGLAPHVLECAGQGDGVATRIVAGAADQLAQTVVAAATSLGLPLQRLPLALTGGTLLESENYRQTVLAALAGRGVRPDPVTAVHEPAEGGVRLALAAAGPV
jgi:N-acetylglucosamine kinase-like BadF-type ATPase